MGHIDRLVHGVASAARRSGLRQLVAISPVSELIWKRARGALLGLAPPNGASPAPAASPPAGPPDPLDAIEPRRFKAAMAKRFAALDVDASLKTLYSDFALSTVPRGKHIRDFVSRQTSIAGRRYLDVGCAYGGFLVAFHAAGAREVVGFDYDKELLTFAEAIVQDYGTPARIEHASILDPQIVERFGRFDIITCNDVIEHVSDPKLALQQLSRLLTPQGLLCMEIPNRNAATFVRKDGHFYKFGLTSLPKYLADQRFGRETQGGFHDVTYKSLDWYCNVLERNGIDVTVANFPPADVDAVLAGCSAVFDEIEWKSRQPGVEAPTARYAQRLSRSFRRMHGKFRAGDRSQPASIEFGNKLALTFKEEFWLLLGRPR